MKIDMGSAMAYVMTQLRHEPWDVDRRLTEMRLSREVLLEIADVALNEASNATPFHPANSAGTFSYHHGTWALRDRYVGKDAWVLERLEGVEAILNRDLKLRLVFANVDNACRDEQPPKPRSRKGSGSERASSGNLFSDLPHYAPLQNGVGTTFFLMVDAGGAVELTQRVVEDGTFSTYIERIYLRRGGRDAEVSDILLDGDDAVEFDPQVIRK